MNNRLFSRGLYSEALKQLRVFGFVIGAIMLLIQIAEPCVGYFNYKNVVGTAVNGYVSGYPQAVGTTDIFAVAPLIAYIVAPVMTIILFSVFNKRSASDFYHSLPYTRQCVFTSFFAAIVTWVVALSAVNAGVGLAIHLCMKNVYAVSFVGMWDILFSFFVIALLFICVFMLACSLTGTLLSNVTVGLLLIFLPRMIISIFTNAIGEKLSYIATDYFVPVLSLRYNVPLYYLSGAFFDNLSSDTLIGNQLCDLYMLGISAVVFVLAMAAFRYRKSETASQPASGSRAQALVRCSLCLAISIIATVNLCSGALDICNAIIIYVLALIAYFAYELLSTFKWKNLTKIFPGLISVIVLNIFAAVLLFTFVFVGSSFHPAANDIDSVRFVPVKNEEGSYDDTDSYALRKAGKVSISDDAVAEIVSDALSRSMEYGEGANEIYRIKGDAVSSSNSDASESNYNDRIVAITCGGITRYRNVTFTKAETMKILKILSKDDSFTKAYMTLPEYLDGTMYVNYGEILLDSIQCKEIYKTLQEEIYDAGLVNWRDALRGNYGESETSLTLSFSPENLSRGTINLPIYQTLTPKTFDLILADAYSNSSAFTDTAIGIMTDPGDDSRDISVDIFICKNEGGVPKYWYCSFYEDYDYEEDASKGDGFTYSESLPSEMLAELARSAKDCNKIPTSGGYIRACVNISERLESNNWSNQSITVFLPLPDDFNEEVWQNFVLEYE